MAPCNRSGLKARIYNISQKPLVQGCDAFLDVQVVYRGDDGDPYEVASFEGATGFFPTAVDDGPAVAVTGSLESADKGVVHFELSEEETALIAPGETQSFEVHFRDARGLTILQVLEQLPVAAQLFS